MLRTRFLLIACLAGIVGGITGAAYIGLLHLFQRALWPDHWDRPAHAVILVAVGLSVAALVRMFGSPGDVELMVDNVHVLGGHDDVRALRSLVPVSLLCVAAGGALGPEAPLIQTTGTLGTVLAQRLGLDRTDTRTITITGMAAGFTVLFGAPLGAAVFALEILHRRGLEYYEALLPALIGALWGYGVYVVITGIGLEPVWQFPSALPLHAIDLALAVACGVVGAGVASAFTYTTVGLRRVVVAVPSGLRPAAGGLALGLLAAVSPFALTFAEAQLGEITTTSLAVHVLLLAAATKLVASAVTVASGWRGGFIIPLFFIGAALGQAAHGWFPGTNEWVLVSALMVACNVGVTKTPIGSVLVVSEMAGITVLPTTVIAAVVALLLTSNVSLIESQRRRESVT